MGKAATSVALCFDTRGGIKQEKHASYSDVISQAQTCWHKPRLVNCCRERWLRSGEAGKATADGGQLRG